MAGALGMAGARSHSVSLHGQGQQNSATETRTRVARVRAEYPNQLDYGGPACRGDTCLGPQKSEKIQPFCFALLHSWSRCLWLLAGACWLAPLPLWLLAGATVLGYWLAPLSVATGWLAFGIRN